LKEAREAAYEAQRLAAKGTDPISDRQRRAQNEVGIPTFTSVAATYIRAHRRSWSNPKHARQWVATLKTYARSIVGNTSVDQIDTDAVLAVLRPIWQTKTETAKRVQGRMENILDFASARGWRNPVNPARWRGHLDKLLPSPTKVKRQRNGGSIRHQPAMPYTEVANFIDELSTVEGTAARALRFLILTATRTQETLLAQWPEIDLGTAVWTIPSSRMKAKREHRVPLSEAALAVLHETPRVNGEPWVFPGNKLGRPLSPMALLMVMRRRGFGVDGKRGDYVPHGFRSSFRDWAGDVSSYPTNIAEAALAHVIGDKTEAAYARGDLFVKRQHMMKDWAIWCMASKDKAAPTAAESQQEMSSSHIRSE
jgi:integrase